MKNRNILKCIYVCLFCVFSVSLLTPKANAALVNGSESRLTLHNDGGGEYALFLNQRILGVLDRPSLLEVFKNLDFVNLLPDFKKPFAESFKQIFNIRRAHVDLYWLLALFAPYNHDNELLVRLTASIVFFGLKSSQVFIKLKKFRSDKLNIILESIASGISPPVPLLFEMFRTRELRLDALMSPEDVLVDAKLFAEYVRRIEEYRSRTISRSVGYGYISDQAFKAHQNIGLESDD